MNTGVTETDYAQWLYTVKGLGNKGLEKLLCGGLSCEEIYYMKDKEIRMLIKGKAAENLIEHRKSWDFEAEKKRLLDSKIRFIPRISEEYPQKLKAIPDAPFAIYVKGALPDPGKPSVAIIGARMCSDYGRYMSREFGKGLALAGVQIISGMARGVDGISQKAAISVGGSSFGVLGCGVDVCYPEENRDIFNSICENGGLISEYEPGTNPRANLFPARNRIISALSDVVLVVEARLHSGTQITVDQALEQGKEVFAIPGRVTDRLSDGCNYLISQGAGVAMTVDDVLERVSDMTFKNKAKDSTTSGDDYELEMNEEERLTQEILETIDIIPVSASQIMENLYLKGIEITIPELMGRLMDMTFKGMISQDGVYYRRKMD